MRDEEDLDLICGMEDEMLKRQSLYFYNKQTRITYHEGEIRNVEHVILGTNNDDVRAYTARREDGHGLPYEEYLTNVSSGICHYRPDHEPWVRPKLRLLYLPEQPASIGT